MFVPSDETKHTVNKESSVNEEPSANDETLTADAPLPVEMDVAAISTVESVNPVNEVPPIPDPPMPLVEQGAAATAFVEPPHPANEERSANEEPSANGFRLFALTLHRAGDIEGAAAAVREGLSKHPRDSQLLAMKRQLDSAPKQRPSQQPTTSPVQQASELDQPSSSTAVAATSTVESVHPMKEEPSANNETLTVDAPLPIELDVAAISTVESVHEVPPIPDPPIPPVEQGAATAIVEPPHPANDEPSANGFRLFAPSHQRAGDIEGASAAAHEGLPTHLRDSQFLAMKRQLDSAPTQTVLLGQSSSPPRQETVLAATSQPPLATAIPGVTKTESVLPPGVDTSISFLANSLLSFQLGCLQHEVRGKWAYVYVLLIVICVAVCFPVITVTYVNSCQLKSTVAFDIKSTDYMSLLNNPNIYFCGSFSTELVIQTNTDAGPIFAPFCCSLRGIKYAEHNSQQCAKFKENKKTYEACTYKDGFYCGELSDNTAYYSTLAYVTIDYVECVEASQAIVFAYQWTMYGLIVCSLLYIVLRRLLTSKPHIREAGVLSRPSWEVIMNNTDRHAHLVERITNQVLKTIREQEMPV